MIESLRPNHIIISCIALPHSKLNDQTTKIKKPINPKRLDSIIKHQELIEGEKHFNPGQV